MRHMSIVTTAASIIPQPLLLSPVPSVSTSLHHLLQTVLKTEVEKRCLVYSGRCQSWLVR